AILTVHDVGTNYKSFIRFVNHRSMESVKERAIFLHVCVPGQEDNAPDFTKELPSLGQLGEDLVRVLDEVDVFACIAFGEGAGANIISRCALVWPTLIMGIILVNCTSTPAGFIEYFKDMLINLRLENGVMTQGAWDYLMMHKFGTSDKNEKQQYIDELKNSINARNLSKYLYSFSKRTDFSGIIGAKLDNMDVLMVSGSQSPHLQAVYHMHKGMNKKKTTLLVVGGVCDILHEAPSHLARSLLLLCNDCGVLFGAPIPIKTRQRFSLPNETKVDIFKFLNFDQLLNVRQVNWYFNALIDKYEGEFARKPLFYLSFVRFLIYILENFGFKGKSSEDLLESYKCKEDLKNNNEVVKKCTCKKRFLSNQELEPFNFPLSDQLLKKVGISFDLSFF
uniref:F-box domain-containing protein n=1 Tax=Meloidogyne hapla TaxID=6305 RepID=A0A1I8BRG4_MELHA